MLGVPCLTLRENTERPITITPRHQPARRLRRHSDSHRCESRRWRADRRAPSIDLWDGQASQRIVDVLLSDAPEHHFDPSRPDRQRPRKMRSLTISIVNAGQWRWLVHCLESLAKNPYTLGPSEIVVLDNASDDGTVGQLAAHFPHVRVIPERVRRGFGANHSLIVNAVTTDLALLLNPDTIVLPGALDRLAEAFDNDERVVASGGPILDLDGQVTRRGLERFPTPRRALVEALGLHHLMREWRTATPSASGISTGNGWLSGSALMIDRQVLINLGGFDPRYFMYFEETDFAKRVLETGALIAFVSDAPVLDEGRTSERAADGRHSDADSATLTTTEIERSAMAYMRKHHGRGGVALYRVALLLSATTRLAALHTKAAAHTSIASMSTASKLRQQRRRIAVALRTQSGTSIGDAARRWNEANASVSAVVANCDDRLDQAENAFVLHPCPREIRVASE